MAAGITNSILLVLIIGFAGAAAYVRFFFDPQIDSEYAMQVAEAVGQRIENHAPQVERELTGFGNDAWPIIQSAMLERARNDYPVYARALEQEGTAYFNNVERAFVNKVKARYHEYLLRHRDILTSEFPEHATRKNVEQILAAFEVTLDELVERYYIDQFRREASRTQTLWAAIPPARKPQGNEPSLERQLGDTTRDWTITLLRTPSMLPSTSPEPDRSTSSLQSPASVRPPQPDLNAHTVHAHTVHADTVHARDVNANTVDANTLNARMVSAPQ